MASPCHITRSSKLTRARNDESMGKVSTDSDFAEGRIAVIETDDPTQFVNPTRHARRRAAAVLQTRRTKNW